jgi:hypothetical protein
MLTRTCLRRVWFPLTVAVAALALSTATADAQVVRVTGSDARNTVNFNLGYFALRAEDSRHDDVGEVDVLLANLRAGEGALLFEINDFNGARFGGEWLYAVTDNIEAGVGIGFYQKSVPSVYAELIDSDGTEIAQDLKLRIMPVSATVRFLPVGRGGAVEPYFGAGIGIFNWRYTETGEFVDLSDNTIFRSSYEAKGNAVGPLVLGGIRFPVGAAWAIGGVFRWQRALGDTDSEVSGLLGEKIDLGGWTTNFTIGVRF